MDFENLKVGAICCRVSTEEQETHGSSLESQEELNIQYAKDNNLFVPKEYIFKEQFTGSSIDRPGITQILQLATQRKIDFVIFTKRDRVARSQLVYQRVKKILEDNNVKILYSLEMLTGDTAMDNFVGATMVQFAEWEREQIKQRTYAGKRQYAKNNKWILSHIPYGYKKNFTTKELEIYEEEKRIIEKIVKYLLVDGFTLGVIAKKLTNEKILCPLASSNIKKGLDIDYNVSSIRKNGIYFWSVSNLHRILKRAEMYAGTYQAFKKMYKLEGKQSLFIGERPKEEWINIKIPAIITEKQAKDIIEKMQNNRRFSKKQTQRTYLLQGKLFCDCEAKHHNFVGYFNPKKNLRNYRCGLYNSSKVEKERRCSNHISGLKIEPIIINTMRELLTDTEYLFELSLNKYLGGNARDKEGGEVYLQIYGDYLMIDEKKGRLEELFLDGLIDKKSFIKRKNALDIEKETLAKELSEKQEYLINSCYRETAKKSILEITKENQKAIEKFFDEASYEELKELINIVVDKVIIPKDKRKEIQIIMKIDGNIPIFQEKYSEEVFATYTDENGNIHNICPLGTQEPKLLELGPSSNPYLYRSVGFMGDNTIGDGKNFLANDNNFPGSNFSGGNSRGGNINFPHGEYDTKFLDYISEKFIASGRCLHSCKIQSDTCLFSQFLSIFNPRRVLFSDIFMGHVPKYLADSIHLCVMRAQYIAKQTNISKIHTFSRLFLIFDHNAGVIGSMHLIVDIRADRPEDMIRVRYAENWVHLWREYFPHDTHTFLIFDGQTAPEHERTFSVKRDNWFSGRRRLSLRGSNDIFRAINFSRYAPYDPSIPTTSHIFDMSEWFYDPLTNSKIWYRKKREYEIRKYLRESAHIVVPNFLTGSELVELWNTEESKIDILPYITMKPVEKDGGVFFRLQIAKPYFLHDSSMGNESHIHALIRGFAQYKHDGGKAVLVLHGNTDQSLRSITETIRAENVQESVRITGYLNIHEQEALYDEALGWIFIGAYATPRLALGLALSKKLPLLLSDIQAFDMFHIPKIHPNHADEIPIALHRMEADGNALIPQDMPIDDTKILMEYRRILSIGNEEGLQKEIFSI